MKLWTSMPETVYSVTLVKTGIYRCVPDKCDMLLDDTDDLRYHKAYEWMSERMKESIGNAPEGVHYPVWAWYQVRGIHTKPDLRWFEFRHFKVPMILIEFELADSKVLLSDEEKWTCAQLNDGPWCETQKEMSWYYQCPEDPLRQKFKKETWNRIFDIKGSERIQATCWEIQKNMVTEIWHYNRK